MNITVKFQDTESKNERELVAPYGKSTFKEAAIITLSWQVFCIDCQLSKVEIDFYGMPIKVTPDTINVNGKDVQVSGLAAEIENSYDIDTMPVIVGNGTQQNVINFPNDNTFAIQAVYDMTPDSNVVICAKLGFVAVLENGYVTIHKTTPEHGVSKSKFALSQLSLISDHIKE